MILLVILGLVAAVLLVAAIMLSRPSKTKKVTPAPSGTGATAPAGVGATTSAPAGTTTTTTSTTTSSRTWWGVSIKWWLVVTLLIASLAIIWLGDIIVTLVPVQNMDWRSALTDWKVLASVGVVAIVILIATTSLQKSVTGLKSIPLIPLLWVGVVGYFLYQAGAGLYNWMSAPTQRTQVVEFPNFNTSAGVGQQRSIDVGPLETWNIRTGTVSGQNPHPNWYWTCPTSNLSILQGRVFRSRNIGYNTFEQSFTEAARLQLVQEGITSVTVTYIRQFGRPGRTSPCDQQVTVQ